MLSKQELNATIDMISRMSFHDVKKVLEDKYQKINLGSKTDWKVNSFEMIALYQQILRLAGYTVAITGIFDTYTYMYLKEYQKVIWAREDGLPGRETTGKILTRLSAVDLERKQVENIM